MIAPLLERHGLVAAKAPGDGSHLDDLKPGALDEGSSSAQVEPKPQRVGLDTRQAPTSRQTRVTWVNGSLRACSSISSTIPWHRLNSCMLATPLSGCVDASSRLLRCRPGHIRRLPHHRQTRVRAAEGDGHTLPGAAVA